MTPVSKSLGIEDDPRLGLLGGSDSDFRAAWQLVRMSTLWPLALIGVIGLMIDVIVLVLAPHRGDVSNVGLAAGSVLAFATMSGAAILAVIRKQQFGLVALVGDGLEDLADRLLGDVARSEFAGAAPFGASTTGNTPESLADVRQILCRA